MMAKTQTRFNPPPNWSLPAGFRPPPGWQPDPEWGPPPQGWPLWVTTEKKSHVVRNVILGVVALAVCGIAGCVTLVARAAHDTVAGGTQEQSAAAASCQGKSYPDQQRDHDYCANGAGAVDLKGLKITATPLKRGSGGNLCSNVNYVNNSDQTVSFNTLDWRVQSPSGEVQNNVFAGGGNLGSGDLIKGGTKSGSMCFDPVAGSGTFVTIYQAPISQMRGVWLSAVQ